jgi:hypothetical protein
LRRRRPFLKSPKKVKLLRSTDCGLVAHARVVQQRDDRSKIHQTKKFPAASEHTNVFLV